MNVDDKMLVIVKIRFPLIKIFTKRPKTLKLRLRNINQYRQRAMRLSVGAKCKKCFGRSDEDWSFFSILRLILIPPSN